MTVEIRTFAESDRSELLEVFERAGEGAPGSRLWGHAVSEAAVYLTRYMDLLPDSLFVAVVDGAITGYLTGCLDAASLPRETDRIASAPRTHHVMRRPSAVPFFVRSLWDVSWSRLRGRATAGDFDDPRWPAHLHINVVAEARGTGIAPSLMGRWFDELREVGAPGCHLQTLWRTPEPCASSSGWVSCARHRTTRPWPATPQPANASADDGLEPVTGRHARSPATRTGRSRDVAAQTMRSVLRHRRGHGCARVMLRAPIGMHTAWDEPSTALATSIEERS